ncbi:MAG: hypothetical protein U0359_31690 [Byssovorax sp.]
MASIRRAIAVLGSMLLLGGTATCNLVAGLGDYEFSDGGSGTACTVAADCNDQNPCTDDGCVNGTCVASPVADGPSSVSKPGDCKVTVCTGGAAKEQVDDTDIPADDNDCTADTCAEGHPHNTALPDGDGCTLNGHPGTCVGGTCEVACGADLPPCDDGKPCTEDTCDEGKGRCSFEPLEDGTKTPGAMDLPGDCLGHVCSGGKDVIVNDDADVPKTETDCDQELCNAGVPSNPALPPDTPCFTAGGAVCDGQGACVACNTDGKCAGPSDDCQHPGCVEHACKPVFTPPNTPVSPALQMPGDCHQKVCDGAGGIVSNVDDTDAQTDGNPCTDDVCVNGEAKHPPSAAGTACGMGGMVCSGQGSCVGCVDDSSCMAPATCGGCGVANTCCCQPKTCAQLGVTCGMVGNGCGGQLQCNNGIKDGTETDVDCGGSSCATPCGQGKACSAGTDCASTFCADGVCCESACGAACQSCNQPNKLGICSAINMGQDNSPAGICSGTSTCANGVCKKLNGQPCAANAECTSGACADGVCCSGTCTGVCRACNLMGSVGTCTNVPAGQQDPTANIPCIGTSVCDGNAVCKKGNGQACGSGNDCASTFCADGVCCNNACNTTCQSCNLAGSVGTCSNIPQYTNDSSPSCAMAQTCDGAGLCLKTNGQLCALGSECASHKCTGGTCTP